jgi:hypothetical protein
LEAFIGLVLSSGNGILGEEKWNLKQNQGRLDEGRLDT